MICPSSSCWVRWKFYRRGWNRPLLLKTQRRFSPSMICMRRNARVPIWCRRSSHKSPRLTMCCSSMSSSAANAFFDDSASHRPTTLLKRKAAWLVKFRQAMNCSSRNSSLPARLTTWSQSIAQRFFHVSFSVSVVSTLCD